MYVSSNSYIELRIKEQVESMIFAAMTQFKKNQASMGFELMTVGC